MQGTAIEVYTKLIFVTTKNFTTKWAPPKQLGVPTCELPSAYSGIVGEGVLFEVANFPKRKVPHFIVKISAHKRMEYENKIISAVDVMRAGQCKDSTATLVL